MLLLPDKPTIFVQIAAYKDKDLIPTLQDILQKAKYPERLTFGICWQHDFSQDLKPFLYDKRFKILSVDWSASRGCCWARSKTQALYDGEDLTLQIDSHMRFAQNWDVDAIELLKACNHDKPILSYYPPQFEFIDGKEVLSPHTTPQAISITKFESNFIPYYGSTLLLNPHAPELGRFLAAGFLFTLGKWCYEVPYNPSIYFLGEETDLALRSYTKGYNVFHPHKSVCWHYFIRKGEPRHWEDHIVKNVESGLVKEDYVTTSVRGWHELQQLFWENNPQLGIHGLGTERSRRSFEMFAGINFKRKLIHPDSGKKIPPITVDPNWEDNVLPAYHFNKTITLDLSEVPILDDYEFWYFALHNDQYTEIWRQDFRESQYLIDRKNTVDINVMLDHQPRTWTLWPFSKTKGWVGKTVRPI